MEGMENPDVVKHILSKVPPADRSRLEDVNAEWWEISKQPDCPRFDQPYGPLLVSYNPQAVAFGFPTPSHVSVFDAKAGEWLDLEPIGSSLTLDQENGKVYAVGNDGIHMMDLTCGGIKEWTWRRKTPWTKQVNDILHAALGSEVEALNAIGATSGKVVVGFKKQDEWRPVCLISHDCITGEMHSATVDHDVNFGSKHMGRGIFIWMLKDSGSFAALDAKTLSLTEHPLPGAVKRSGADTWSSTGDGRILIKLSNGNGDMLVGAEEALFRDDDTDWKLVQQVNAPIMIEEIKHDAMGGVHGIVDHKVAELKREYCIWKGHYEDSKLVWDGKAKELAESGGWGFYNHCLH